MDTVSSPSSTNSYEPELEKCHYLQGFTWRKMYLSVHTYRNLVSLISVNSLAIIPTILLNTKVIVVVATGRRLQTNSNILLACLAVTDLLAGLFLQPIAIAVEVKRAFGIEPFCKLRVVYSIAALGLVFASISHLLLISLDRYIATKHPLRYLEIVTKKRIYKCVLVAWAIAVVVTVQEITLAIIESGNNIYSVVWTLTGVIDCLVGLVYIGGICYCYAYIFKETRRQKKRLQTEQLTQEEAKRMKKDNKASNTLALILGAMIITYLPLIIVFLFRDMVSPSARVTFYSWASTSALLGSLANPIIYCWRNKKLRRAFLEICHVRQPENRAPDIEVQRHPSEIQPSNGETFSMVVTNQEPVLLSFRNLQAGEIVELQEINDEIL